LEVKTIRFLLLGWLILSIGVGLGCAKKVVYSDATPFTPSKIEPRSEEIKAEKKAEEKPVVPPSERPAVLAPEKKIIEESLPKDDLREKALREEAQKREALTKETTLIKQKLNSIFFDFDQAVIREDQKEIMAKNAEWLKTNPQARIRIEGNCDERGTAEYNLALGQRRAEVAKDFLQGLGIAAQRMQTISYGFERPLTQGHNEEAWSKNRRVDFVPLR